MSQWIAIDWRCISRARQWCVGKFEHATEIRRNEYKNSFYITFFRQRTSTGFDV